MHVLSLRHSFMHNLASRIECILPPDVLKILYPTFNVLLKKIPVVDWRDGKEADNTYCSCRRPGFCFCTHTAANNVMQLCFQWILIPSSSLCSFCTQCT